MKDFTLKDIIYILTLFTGIIWNYATSTTRILELEKADKIHDLKFKEMEAAAAKNTEKIYIKLDQIQTDITEIKIQIAKNQK